MHLLLQIIAWLIALAWSLSVFAAWRGLPGVPDLLDPSWDMTPPGLPYLTVIVPARNEGPNIAASLESLLAQDYPFLRIVAVDDRSMDETGSIMDALAATCPHRLRVKHVTELPPGWLGKTHAMATTAREVIAADAPEFLLFTDADVLFAPSALRRALLYAVASEADHLVLMPTTIVRRWDEAALLSFFTLFGLWGGRAWRVADPKSKRDALGIGAFNMLRRSAYETIGGYESLRMTIVEDLGIARRVKGAGLKQRVAFGRGLVSLHWASGVPGLIGVLTKNIFAVFHFRPERLLGACLWLSLFYIAPFAAVWFQLTVLPSALVLGLLVCGYRLFGRLSGLSAWNALLAPFAAAILVFTLLRSMVTTLRQGGVVWRGTFYPLAELRKYVVPLL